MSVHLKTNVTRLRSTKLITWIGDIQQLFGSKSVFRVIFEIRQLVQQLFVMWLNFNFKFPKLTGYNIENLFVFWFIHFLKLIKNLICSKFDQWRKWKVEQKPVDSTQNRRPGQVFRTRCFTSVLDARAHIMKAAPACMMYVDAEIVGLKIIPKEKVGENWSEIFIKFLKFKLSFISKKFCLLMGFSL